MAAERAAMRRSESKTRFSIRLPKRGQALTSPKAEREGGSGGGGGGEDALQVIDDDEEFFGQTLGGIPKPPRRQGLYYVPGKDIVNGMEQGEWLSSRCVVSNPGAKRQSLRRCPTSSSPRACSSTLCV